MGDQGKNENGKWESYKKILIPLFVMWMGWVSLTAYNGASLSKVSSVLHRRITATKQEIVQERNEALNEIKAEMKEIRKLLMQILLKNEVE